MARPEIYLARPEYLEYYDFGPGVFGEKIERQFILFNYFSLGKIN